MTLKTITEKTYHRNFQKKIQMTSLICQVSFVRTTPYYISPYIYPKFRINFIRFRGARDSSKDGVSWAAGGRGQLGIRSFSPNYSFKITLQIEIPEASFEGAGGRRPPPPKKKEKKKKRKKKRKKERKKEKKRKKKKKKEGNYE